MDEHRVEIDPKLLPECALLDTGVLIRALGERPEDPDSPACVALFEAMLTHRRRILIAAPSLAEIIRNGSAARPPRVSLVSVVAFDQEAAYILGTRFPSHVLSEFSTETGVSLTYLKYDALIVACAIRHKADCVVTIEHKKMPNLAKSVEFMARSPAEFIAKQISLPLSGF